MKSQKDSLRDAIQGMVLTTTSLDKVSDLLIRYKMIKRAQSDTLATPGFRSGMADHVKIVPAISKDSSKGKG